MERGQRTIYLIYNPWPGSAGCIHTRELVHTPHAYYPIRHVNIHISNLYICGVLSVWVCGRSMWSFVQPLRITTVCANRGCFDRRRDGIHPQLPSLPHLVWFDPLCTCCEIQLCLLFYLLYINVVVDVRNSFNNIFCSLCYLFITFRKL